MNGTVAERSERSPGEAVETQVWTSALVRWRLRNVGDVLRMLPRVGPSAIRSGMPECLREIFKDAAPAPTRAKASGEQIDQLDVTVAAVLAVARDATDQALLHAVMLNVGSTRLAKRLERRELRGCYKLSERAVRWRTESLCSLLADGWNRIGYPVDAATLDAAGAAERRAGLGPSPDLIVDRVGEATIKAWRPFGVAGAGWSGEREAVEK